MPKYTKAERAESFANLRKWLKPGDTVHTILDHVSRSGMSRNIRVVLLKDGEAFHPNYAVSVVLGMSRAKHGDGISLVPASIESKVWRDVVWKRAWAILFLHGRTRFCNPDGSTTTGRPLRPVALIAWSEYDALVLHRSSLAGVLLTSWGQR